MNKTPYAGIYWSNHHHLFHPVERVNGGILWANLHLQSVLAKSIRGDRKGKISVVLYAIAIPLAFVNVWLPCAIYVGVAAIWIVPDPRIERMVS